GRQDSPRHASPPRAHRDRPLQDHTENQPFQDTPITSPNTTEREQGQHNMAIELKGEGKTQPPDPFARYRQGGQMPQRPVSAGPMVDETYTMIRFVPDVAPYGNTDASYHLPAFYELWARWGPEEDRAFWAKAADVSRELFVKVTGPDTGLTPDRSNVDISAITGR